MTAYSSSPLGTPSGTLPPPPPPGYGPPPRRSPWPGIALGCGITALVLLLLGVLLMFSLPFWLPFAVFSQSRSTSGFELGGNVAMIDISGEIHTGGETGGFFAESGSSEPIMEALRQAAEDDNIKAVVLNLNSPGGTPGASQAIAMEVTRLAAKKPVVAAMGDVAASGAYYVAAPCTKIMALPATLTGSIGVRMELLRFYGLMQKWGVEGEEITSGKFKDVGSPFRPMRPEERALLQGVINETYNQFVKDVATGRKMPEAQVRQLADGRIYTGSQAKQKGLVDELGNLHDAIALAGKLGGVKGKPEVRSFTKPFDFGRLFGAEAGLPWPLRGLYGLPAAPSATWRGAAPRTELGPGPPAGER